MLNFDIVNVDNVLVAVGYYIGSEREYDGEFPFTVLGYLCAVAMISSEIVAKIKRKKINPARQNNTNRMSLVISNLIPFTRLNTIFAFSIVVSAVIKVVQSTQIGLPKLSIQITAMLLCLLFSNDEALTHTKKKVAPLVPVSSVFLKQTSNQRVNTERAIKSTNINLPQTNPEINSINPDIGVDKTPTPVSVSELILVAPTKHHQDHPAYIC